MEFHGFRKALPGEEKGYFQMSGIRESRKLKHHPFVALHDGKVGIYDSAQKLLEECPIDAYVIAQWSGQWSSDYFYFKVSDLMAHIALVPKEDYMIV